MVSSTWRGESCQQVPASPCSKASGRASGQITLQPAGWCQGVLINAEALGGMATSFFEGKKSSPHPSLPFCPPKKHGRDCRKEPVSWHIRKTRLWVPCSSCTKHKKLSSDKRKASWTWWLWQHCCHGPAHLPGPHGTDQTCPLMAAGAGFAAEDLAAHLSIIFGLWGRDALLWHGERSPVLATTWRVSLRRTPLPESPGLLNNATCTVLDETSAVGVILCWCLGKLLGSTRGKWTRTDPSHNPTENIPLCLYFSLEPKNNAEKETKQEKHHQQLNLFSAARPGWREVEGLSRDPQCHREDILKEVVSCEERENGEYSPGRIGLGRLFHFWHGELLHLIPQSPHSSHHQISTFLYYRCNFHTPKPRGRTLTHIMWHPDHSQLSDSFEFPAPTHSINQSFVREENIAADRNRTKLFPVPCQPNY